MNIDFSCWSPLTPPCYDDISSMPERIGKKYANYFCNDDQIIRIIFSIAEKTGCITSDCDLGQNAQYPPEINYVLSQLQREFPHFEGFNDDKSAFDFIRSRYAQSGGELTDFVDYLVNEANTINSEIAASKNLKND